MKKRPKYVTVVVSIPNATAANTPKENYFETDRDYKYVDHVEVHIGQPGTVQNTYGYLDIGLRDSVQGLIHDPCHHQSWLGLYAQPGKKGKDVLIPCDGRKVYGTVVPPVVMTADQTVQFVFRQVDELVEIAQTSI